MLDFVFKKGLDYLNIYITTPFDVKEDQNSTRQKDRFSCGVFSILEGSIFYGVIWTQQPLEYNEPRVLP